MGKAAADVASPCHRSLSPMLWVLTRPNIVIDLTAPVVARGLRARPVRAVAHRLDDPEAFRRRIAALPCRAGLR